MTQTWLVIAFGSTTAALQMERLANKARIPGKLIPIPRQLSATCGMAFRAEPQYQQQLEQLAQSAGLDVESFTLLQL